MDERLLIERRRRGERAAQRELYERTAGRIYGLLLKMTRNPDEAFDLAQQTYLRAFDRIRKFDGTSSVTTWLYRIAVNEALQAARRSRTARRAGESLGRTASAEGRSAIDLRMDIDEAMRNLSEDDRLILFLRYREGLDYGAISHVMELPAGTVASRLNRARDRLRKKLKSYAPAEESGARPHPTGQQPEGELEPRDLRVEPAHVSDSGAP